MSRAGRSKRRAARGRDDGQLMELWLGPSQRGSRFRDEAEPRGAWAENRNRLMERWGGRGRPAEGGGGVGGRGPSLPRVRSRAFLPVRARPLRRRREGRVPHWREEFDRAHSPGLFHCAGPGKFLDRDAARRAHFAWANIPSSLVDAWTAERQTDEDRDA